MTWKLTGQEGLLKGQTIALAEGEEWRLGRDPDMSNVVLQDPSVSRQHLLIRKKGDNYTIENLSTTNPILLDGLAITQASPIKEGSLIKVGATTFLFTGIDEPALEITAAAIPKDAEEYNTIFEAAPEIQSATLLDLSLRQRWLIKVIGGPQSGAEFSMERGKSYVIGSDPTLCDIIFYDLSVSRKHAKITVRENETCLIEDLGSRNGVLVDSVKIDKPTDLKGNEVIGLGTTSFVVVDREKSSETVLALAPEEKKEKEKAPPPVEVPLWKKALSSREVQITTFVLCLVGFFAVFGITSLFQSVPVVEVPVKDYHDEIGAVMKAYPDVSWSYNKTNSKLFLVGHVLTPVNKTELEYALKNLKFVSQLDDSNVIIDQNIWTQINSLISQNAAWVGISMHADKPGHFVLLGYLQTRQEATALSDWINQNFAYLDRLENRVVVEDDLKVEITSILLSRGFNGAGLAISNGEVTISGMIPEDKVNTFQEALESIKALAGVRAIKNFTTVITAREAIVDLSSQYRVTGSSIKDNTNISVIINGQILSAGDTIDSMIITSIEPNTIFLEKNGLKFKIAYNQ